MFPWNSGVESFLLTIHDNCRGKKTAFKYLNSRMKQVWGRGTVLVLRVVSGQLQVAVQYGVTPSQGDGFSFLPVSSGSCTAVPGHQGLCNQIIVVYSIRILRRFVIGSREDSRGN